MDGESFRNFDYYNNCVGLQYVNRKKPLINSKKYVYLHSKRAENDFFEKKIEWKTQPMRNGRLRVNAYIDIFLEKLE